MKKVLSLVLVIAMVLSSMSFAFASTFEDIADSDYAEAIEMLSALDIIDGYEDGTFKPEKTITRAEMAKLMVITLGFGDLVAGSKSNFADTQGHWADAYIALAAGKGIVLGTGDGNFTPDRTVSYDEAITMLVRGLGYTDNCNELKGMTWPTNFKVKAAELDITDDVVMSASGADRGGVAQLIANALEATLVTVTTDGDVTFLQDTVDNNDKKVDRILITRVASPEYDYEVSADKVDVKNKNFAGEVIDLAPYMFQNLKVYLNDDDQVVYVKDTNSLVLEGTVDEVDGDVLTVENLAGKLVDVDLDDILDKDNKIDKYNVFENGSVRESNFKIADFEDVDTIKVIATDSGKGNGKIEADEIDGFVIENRTEIVRIDKEYVDGKSKIDSIDLPEDNDEVDLENITVEGAAEELADIEEDDIVVVYESEDETVIKLVVVRETVEGKVTRVVDADTYYVDGVKYDLANQSIVTKLELGDEGIFYLDQEGDIADYDGESVGPTDYAVVIGIEDGTTKQKFGEYNVDDYPLLKLATQEGEEVEYAIEVDVDDNGEAEDSATDDKDRDLVNSDLSIDESVVNKHFLIKYKLNKDGRISEIKVEEKLTNSSYDSVDLEKSNNKLAAEAIIFDAGDDYDVVSENKLPDEVEAYVVRNKSGNIIVLVAQDGEVKGAAEEVYVYIKDVDEAYDEDGDEIQVATIYTDGAKVEVETTDDDTINFAKKQGIYAIEYDGDKIDEARRVESAKVVEAETVNAKGNMIKVGTKWFSMSENGTVLTIEKVDEDGVYKVDDVADLYDIDEEKTKIEVYVNDDKDIDLILIIDEDYRDEAEEVDKTALNTAITAAETKIAAGNYTKDTLDAANAKLTAAKAVKNDDNATEAEVETAIAELNTAVAALELVLGDYEIEAEYIPTPFGNKVQFDMPEGQTTITSVTVEGKSTTSFSVNSGEGRVKVSAATDDVVVVIGGVEYKIVVK